MMPRLTASSASARSLQWVKGKPLLSGVSQARAMMAQACSGLILAGAPERGASLKRSRASAELSALERQRAPLAHRFAPDIKARGDLSNLQALGRKKDHARARRDLLRGPVPANQAFQFTALFGADFKGGGRTTHIHPPLRITRQTKSQITMGEKPDV